jgi:hypothetical protein
MTHRGYIDKGNDPGDISPVTGRYTHKGRNTNTEYWIKITNKEEITSTGY